VGRPFASVLPGLAGDRTIADAMRLGGFFAQALLLVLFVLVVVTSEECPLRIAFAGQDVGGDTVEEPAVVGGDQHAAGEFQQGVFECAQGFHVEVVRRFIEQQHVAAGEQGLGQMQAATLTAGEVADSSSQTHTNHSSHGWRLQDENCSRAKCA